MQIALHRVWYDQMKSDIFQHCDSYMFSTSLPSNIRTRTVGINISELVAFIHNSADSLTIFDNTLIL